MNPPPKHKPKSEALARFVKLNGRAFKTSTQWFAKVSDDHQGKGATEEEAIKMALKSLDA